MSEFDRARQNMVDNQIRPASITDWRIIDAMRSVPREAFLPEPKRAMAYLDCDVEIGGNGGGRHFLLNPIGIARLLQSAEIEAQDHVLIVGCTTGYLAALAARLAARVTATIDDESLASQARAVLAQQGVANAAVQIAKPGEGAALHGPYDAIVLNGATEIEPTALYQQLKLGGRLVGAFATGKPQRVTVITRSPGDFGARVLFDAAMPVLPGLTRAPAFVF